MAYRVTGLTEPARVTLTVTTDQAYPQDGTGTIDATGAGSHLVYLSAGPEHRFEHRISASLVTTGTPSVELARAEVSGVTRRSPCFHAASGRELPGADGR